MVLVGYSGVNGLVSLVVDRYLELVYWIVWVDFGFMSDGGVFVLDLFEEIVELLFFDFDIFGK